MYQYVNSPNIIDLFFLYGFNSVVPSTIIVAIMILEKHKLSSSIIFSLLALYAFFFFLFRKYHVMIILYPPAHSAFFFFRFRKNHCMTILSSPAPSAFFFFYFCKYYGTFVSFSFQFIALCAL